MNIYTKYEIICYYKKLNFWGNWVVHCLVVKYNKRTLKPRYKSIYVCDRYAENFKITLT